MTKKITQESTQVIEEVEVIEKPLSNHDRLENFHSKFVSPCGEYHQFHDEHSILARNIQLMGWTKEAVK